MPEHLRYAFGAKEPLASPDDFAGARVRVKPSGATDALMRALGATPVHISGDDVADAVANGEIDGAEASLGTNSTEEGETHLTANLPLFPKTLTLFAGDGAYDRLDEDQREAIREAARMTAAYAAAHAPSETGADARLLPRGPARERGRGERRRRRRARGRRPARLHAARAGSGHEGRDRRDPCAQGGVARGSRGGSARGLRDRAVDRERPGAVPVGRQRHLSLAGDRAGRARRRASGRRLARTTEDVGTVGKMTLRDGRWLLGDTDPEEYSGTYEIVGDRLVFDWGESTLTFEFARDDDGTIQLRPLPPMNAGDAVVWAGGPVAARRPAGARHPLTRGQGV